MDVIMPKPTHIALLTAAAVLAAPLPALAAGEAIQDLDQLDVLVAAAMGAEIGQPGGARAPIDRRLKLKACPEMPEINGPDMQAAAVRCPSIGWRIRVPLLPIAGSTPAGQTNTQTNTAQRQGGEIVVKRGEPILLTVERPAFTLTRVMIADKDGKVGDVIPVREEPRGTPIFVRIVESGRATVL